MLRRLYTLIALVPTLLLAQTSYVSKVYEFMPAPGQFTNTLPQYEAGDTQETMIQKAEDIVATPDGGLISLGGFGGYITYGFDHPIENVHGHFDFSVLGNAFYAASNPNPDAPKDGGSSEPGIVMVSQDANGNGLPDDAWYELAGSEYSNPATRHNVSFTYYRTPHDHTPTPLPKSQINDTTYVKYTTSFDSTGYVMKNVYHKQAYYPEWLTQDSYTLSGTLLPRNAIDESGKGTYWVLYMLPWGYSDNYPNDDDRSKFNIDWAVDSTGKHVTLDHIDFIRVYNGMNQYCGWLGETSTEFAGSFDLHMTGGDTEDIYYIETHTPDIPSDESIPVEIYNLSGVRVDSLTQPGIYIIVKGSDTYKTIVR